MGGGDARRRAANESYPFQMKSKRVEKEFYCFFRDRLDWEDWFKTYILILRT